MYWYQDGRMVVYMINYLQKSIDNFPEVTQSSSATYAVEYLFIVWYDKERKLLPGGQAQHFRHTVAQFLFLCMRYRPDIQPLVDFLTTRVRSPEKYDWGKLKRGMNYLIGTIYLKLYIRADYLNMIIWWVDASYYTHWYCKIHTGAVMSMGAGAILSFSRKQKLNTGRLTEAELVVIADALGLMIWNKYFMEAQVYSIYSDIMFQDNQYTILIANNSSNSTVKKRKHIKNRYFIITYKAHQEDL